jgi:glycerol-3-phosphate O-acyltransferase
MNTMAGDAIVCRALHRNGGRAGYREVRDDSRFLSRLFKREFLYRADRGFEACFDDHLAALARRGFLDVHDDGRIIGREPAPTAILAGLLDSFVEAYWVMASTMADLRRSPLRQEEILGRAMERARRGFLEGRIARPECANRTLMQNAADWMLATGVIEAQVSGRERTLRLTPEYELGRLETLIHDISVFL